VTCAHGVRLEDRLVPGGDRRKFYRRGDWVLERQGWKVLRFRRSTIHERASNSAYVVNKELQASG